MNVNEALFTVRETGIESTNQHIPEGELIYLYKPLITANQ